MFRIGIDVGGTFTDLVCVDAEGQVTLAKGARVGLLTTAGHRDVLEMREGLKDDRYNLRQPPPTQLVPRQRRLGVRERLRPDGRVEIPLDLGSLEAAIARLKAEAVEAIAIRYLHSWRDA